MKLFFPPSEGASAYEIRQSRPAFVQPDDPGVDLAKRRKRLDLGGMAALALAGGVQIGLAVLLITWMWR